jgi:hypothetical protein
MWPLALCLALLSGCVSETAPTVTGTGVCSQPLSRLFGPGVPDTEVVNTLEQARQEHEPTADELKMATAFLVLVADSVRKKRLHPNLTLLDFETRVLAIASKYEAIYADCGAGSRRATAQRSEPYGQKRFRLSGTPECYDNCNRIVWEEAERQIAGAAREVVVDPLVGKSLNMNKHRALVAAFTKEYDTANGLVAGINAITANEIDEYARSVVEVAGLVTGKTGLATLSLTVKAMIVAIDAGFAIAKARQDQADCVALQKVLCRDAGGPGPDAGVADSSVVPDIGIADSNDSLDATVDSKEDAAADSMVDTILDVTVDMTPQGLVCTLPFADCGEGFCTDLDSSSQHCGACGKACASGLCTGGQCSPLCGNGKIDPGEDCDGADLNGKTCLSFFGSQSGLQGALKCSSQCKYDLAQCGQCPAQCTPTRMPGNANNWICDCTKCLYNSATCGYQECPTGCSVALTGWAASSSLYASLYAITCKCDQNQVTAVIPPCQHCATGGIAMARTLFEERNEKRVLLRQFQCAADLRFGPGRVPLRS